MRNGALAGLAGLLATAGLISLGELASQLLLGDPLTPQRLATLAVAALAVVAAGLLTRVLPYITVVIAAFAPLAAGLYLLTTVAWTTGERRLFLHRTERGWSASWPSPWSGRRRPL